MERSYINFNNATYLSLTLKDSKQIDTVTIGMMRNNDIPGLLKPNFHLVDDSLCIRYAISGYIEVGQYLSGTVTQEQICQVFLGIIKAYEEAENYMIPLNELQADMSSVFINPMTGAVALVCIPSEVCAGQSISNVLKNYIINVRFDDSNGDRYISEILNALNSSSFSLPDLKELLVQMKAKRPVPERQNPSVGQPIQQPVNTYSQNTSMGNPAVSQPVRQPVQQPIQQQPVQQPIQQPVQQPVRNVPPMNNAVQQPPVQQPVTRQQPESMQESDEEEEKPMSFFHLLRNFNKENLELYKAGKEKRNRDDDEPEFGGVQENPGFALPGQKDEIPGIQPQKSSAPAQREMSAQQPAQQPVRQPVQQPVQSANIQNTPPVQNNAAPNQQAPATQQTTAGQSGQNFGSTVMFNQIGNFGGTMILDDFSAAPAKTCPFLTRESTGEEIDINSGYFTLGTGTNCNYCAEPQTGISRMHAIISQRNNDYYLQVQKTTNGTFINRQQLAPGSEIQLRDGMVLHFAHEPFVYHTR